MKKILALALSTVLLLTACGGGGGPSSSSSGGSASSAPGEADRSGFTIRVYSDANTPEQTAWLIGRAAAAGFTISMDDSSVLFGSDDVLQAAIEGRDGDVLIGLNDARWGKLVKGEHPGLELEEWTPSWSSHVGGYVFPGRAYGLTAQNVLMFYRTDELGTNGEQLRFTHWADVADCGYVWYRQCRMDGAISSHVNSAMLYAFVDPGSPAGGVSVEGWKALWRYCAGGKNEGDLYQFGFDPLARGDVQVSTFHSSALYDKVNASAEVSDHPLLGTVAPENWAVVDIAEGTFYIAKYMGVLAREGRSPEQTEIVKEFAQWLGSDEVQADWSEAFGTFPCNREAADILYPNGVNIYSLRNFATVQVDGVMYAEYAADHAEQWANIMTGLGFFWDDASRPSPEPDWDSLDWEALCRG